MRAADRAALGSREPRGWVEVLIVATAIAGEHRYAAQANADGIVPDAPRDRRTEDPAPHPDPLGAGSSPAPRRSRRAAIPSVAACLGILGRRRCRRGVDIVHANRRTTGRVRETCGAPSACDSQPPVYRVGMAASPRIPPPPMPEIDWSSTTAYLKSCNAWLDAMERWRIETLPAWIDATRTHLLGQALLRPGDAATLPDPRDGTGRVPEKPLDAVAEIRLPALD
jgi:hypothetical protein